MKTLNTPKIVIISIISVLSILAGSVGCWISKNVMDQEAYVTRVTNAIQSEDSAAAISNEILNKVLVDRPILRKVAEKTVEPALAGVIASDKLTPVLQKVTKKVHQIAIAQEPAEVAIDISDQAEFIRQVITLVESQRETKISASDIPDKIVILEKEEVPSVHDAVVAAIWVRYIGALLGVVLFVLLVWATKGVMRQKALKIFGISLSGASLLFVLFTHNTIDTFTASIGNENVRVVATNLVSPLISALDMQTWLLFIAGILIFAIGVFLPNLEKAVTKFRQFRQKK